MMKVLIIDNVHPLIEERFTKLGWKCDLMLTASREELLRVIDQYEGLVLRSRVKIDESFLSAANNLKFIGRPGAGLENIDLNYCEQRGIEVFRSPEGNRDAVAEHAIGMLLMLFNRLKIADAEVRQGIWKREENRGYELMDKTVGIIGYGYMGKAFAQRLSGFGCQVIAYDKYLENYADEYAMEVSLEELKERADIISLHLPQSPETIHYVDDEFINDVSKPFYLINTARGKSVNTNAVLEAMDDGKMAGACLDVLEFESSSFEEMTSENPVFQRLVAHEKVLLSPHIAGWTHEAKYKLGHYLAEKIIERFG
jgi:D-3-phosphoglycerate dehydrogenase